MNLKFELTNKELDIILNSLSQMPYQQVAQIIEKLVNDARKQVNAKEAVATEGK